MDELNAKIDVPLAPPRPGYSSNHVEVGRLTRRQSDALRWVMAGLRLSNAELESGRPVSSNADVIRYLLEQVVPNVPDVPASNRAK